MENVFEIALSNGIFACLFVWLLFYQLKDSSNREKRYIDIIDKLSIQLDVVEDVKEDVQIIKDKLFLDKEQKDEEKNQNL